MTNPTSTAATPARQSASQPAGGASSGATPSRSSALAWWCALTILVSAFLLFQVQPIISKKILPWFGGSPAVWTTCVLFFQLLLLGGYAYSHWMIKYVPTQRQGIIHAVLLLLALFTLPIIPRDSWKPLDGSHPALRILLLLAAVVGPTYFLLSTTGPLVQAWFARLYPGRSPYRLYALSNVGSLAALLTYPFLFETTLRVDHQGSLWSWAFVVFAGLIGILALTMWREEGPGAEVPAPAGESGKRGAAATGPTSTGQTAEGAPSLALRLGWLALAALASMGLLAVTNHLCQDIAVVPFMWVIPLSLYLLSFIICFDNERWYVRKLFGPATILALLWLTAMRNHDRVDEFLIWAQKPVTAMRESSAKAANPENPAPVTPLDFSGVMDKVFDGIDWSVRRLGTFLTRATGRDVVLYFNVDTYDFFDDVIAASTAFLIVLFLICMVCHGELVKSKPQAKYLTSFYLSISAGGALGGLFVALVAPQLFKTHFEVALTIIGGFLAGCLALGNDGREGWLKGRDLLQWAGAFLVVGGVFLISRGNMEGIDPDVIDIERNFYGTVRVEERGDDEERGRYLYNGRIWHGFQYLDPARQLEPTTYYVPGSGAAIAVMEHPRAGEGLRVAVIGLGTGSMAAHGKQGDKYIFYDIDPKVVRVAKERFTYLDKSPAKPEVILGDARIQMERELADGPENYDVIVLDAFSGDAIPAHLLTDEAFALYDQHLHKGADGKTPDGVIVIHISNRYLDLEPVVAALAKKYGYTARVVHKDEEGGPLDTASDWVLVSKNQAFFDQPSVKDPSEPLAPNKEVLWTDQFTALVPILK